MNLNLPSDVNDFVKGLVSQGRFNSEEDAIVEGIKLLMGREQLRSEVQKGVAQWMQVSFTMKIPCLTRSMQKLTR